MCPSSDQKQASFLQSSPEGLCPSVYPNVHLQPGKQVAFCSQINFPLLDEVVSFTKEGCFHLSPPAGKIQIKFGKEYLTDEDVLSSVNRFDAGV